MTVSTQPHTLASAPLYALAPLYAEIVNEMIEAEGDMSDDELVNRLNRIQDAFSDKVEACQMVYRALVAEAKAADEFIKPWRERAERRQRAADRLKQYVFANMAAAGQTRIETPLGGARLQNSPPSVKFAGDPKTLPAVYQKVTVDIDRTKVLEAHKAQATLPLGVSIEVGQHLRWL